ncbi:MAG TPA: hypothetical protein VN829_12370 [Dongiaceae bacterium]|nr:hypothetical protein [Dongiaceae bacterium]
MKPHREVTKSKAGLRRALWQGLLAIAVALAAGQPAQAAPNIVLWDTLSPLSGDAEAQDRTGWKVVPSDLLSLEADPSTASSDPGYYGREYLFKGDAVVENSRLAAVFRSAKGQVDLYLKEAAASPPGAAGLKGTLGRKIVELEPLATKARGAIVSRVEIVRNAGDETALEVTFSAKGGPEATGVLVFGKTEIVEIRPGANMNGLSVAAELEHVIAPSFIGDDLILSPAEYPAAETLWVPAENLLLGLVAGEQSQLVMTWPKGRQHLALRLGAAQPGKRLVQSIDFDNDHHSLYLAVQGAPGIWHQEALPSSYLEKEVPSRWERPFQARWKTQLWEAGVRTTFAFRESKGHVWRGVAGAYGYPVWFDGEAAFYHLSKKVPPQGESIVYFLEGRDTPFGVSTPVDIMEATLGREVCGPILDVTGRQLRTHHRRGADGVRRACTCGCTEAIQAVFAAGEEGAKTDYIEGALGDMVFFVHRHVERINQYIRFAEDMIAFLQAKESELPALKPFLEGLEQTARQIPQEYAVQKENMKSPGYADELTRQTLALAARKGTNNLPAYMELLNAWRGMGGAQDYVLAQCHTLARKLCQRAGYESATQPKADDLAIEIRSRCRQVLRNADGYEIWADY